MSFDALTILGILASLLCGGFLVALVCCNDTSSRVSRRLIRRAEPSPTTHPGP